MRVCPAGVPWHRVVNGRGAISRRGDGSGALSQRLLLEGEGVRFSRGRIDLKRYRWRVDAALRPGAPVPARAPQVIPPAAARVQARPPGARRGGRGDRARRERPHGGPGRGCLRRGGGSDRQVARLPRGGRAHPGARVGSQPGRRATPRRAERPDRPPGRRRRRARRPRATRSAGSLPSAIRGRSACSSTGTSWRTID